MLTKWQGTLEKIPSVFSIFRQGKIAIIPLWSQMEYYVEKKLLDHAAENLSKINAQFIRSAKVSANFSTLNKLNCF